MIGKTVSLTVVFLLSFFLLDPSWGQLVQQVELVRPLPVPVRGDMAVEGNVNVVNTPEVIIREIPEVSVSGEVNVVNSPEVRLVDVGQVEVVNDAGRSIPVRITSPLAALGQKDLKSSFSWHRRAFVNSEAKARSHSAISVSKMAGRPFIMTDLVVTARFRMPDTELILSLKGAGADRGVGLDFILIPEASHLVTHFQTGIVFRPQVGLEVSAAGDREGREFHVDYTITFSGYFVTES